MPAYTNSTAVPRQELVAVIRQGSGLNRFNIWNKVLPVFPVDNQTVHLITKTIAASDIARILDDTFKTQPGAEVEELSMTYGDSTFTVVIRKRKVKIPDEAEMSLSGYLSIEQDASQTGAENLELTNEFLTANALFSTTARASGGFGTASTPVAAYTEANLATIDPIADIQAQIEIINNLGEMPNTLVIPILVWRRMRRCPKLQSYLQSNSGFQGVAGEMITPQILQRALADDGIEKVLLGRSRYNTAAQDATPVFTKMWSSAYIGLFKSGTAFTDNQDGIQTVSGVGCNAYWSKYTPNEGYSVVTYRHEDTESNYVRTSTSIAPYIANTNAGGLIGTSYS